MIGVEWRKGSRRTLYFGFLNDSRKVQYFQRTVPQEESLEDIPIGDLKIMSHERVLAQRKEWLEAKPRLVRVMGTLREAGILYLPADMVKWAWCFLDRPHAVEMTDAEYLAIRIFLAIGKLPPFQRRLGAAYKGPNFFSIFAGGPSKTEKRACSGQFNVAYARQCDCLIYVKESYQSRYPKEDVGQEEDAFFWEWMYNDLVTSFGELNWRALIDGDHLELLDYIRSVMMDVLIPFLADGYFLMQVFRSALDEDLPWLDLTKSLPMGAYSFLLPDQKNHVPLWCFGCTSPMYEEETMNCKIQYISLYACSLSKLVKWEVGWQEDDFAVGDLKRCIQKYEEVHEFRPSPSKFKPWLQSIMEKKPRSSCTDKMIQSIIQK